MRLAIVGVGKMGRSILEGILKAEFLAPQEVGIVDVKEYAQGIAAQYGVRVLTHPELRMAERVLLSVQPKDLPTVAPQVTHPNIGYISIMAGVSTRLLAERLGTRRVVRAMPNLAATIGKSSTAVVGPREAEEAGDLEFARQLFATVGDVYDLPERLFDAFTGMSASAPAYVAVVAEALADGGVKMGIPRAQALKLAADVLIATGELLRHKHPAVIKDEVSSPGGTTIYGVAALEARGIRAALIEAVQAATLRAHELGREE
ncbi:MULTISPECIES: pyrroline-5-carboxylate reductase [unclassified Meiothermus]|uniref:pyrroline-5-carboxylate reductase n=1 Tax=unclassified Meiothermus TaxID=370471 RepID=UPI000D7C3A65|nr:MULTISPECIES: pyrroline-5-carboxylate reductase [unclassified Meiothermus]PZA08428.1 pyrroline-5-carboxylate reductase [Meiothermus sp. Pnk-1]RYM37097.1 pyrroline-5-carboxylate reductase [Meiothermus sp. PNK-Is4]